MAKEAGMFEPPPAPEPTPEEIPIVENYEEVKLSEAVSNRSSVKSEKNPYEEEKEAPRVSQLGEYQ